jgi:hypothetical protein
MRKWAAGFFVLAAGVVFYVACGESPTAPSLGSSSAASSGDKGVVTILGPSSVPYGPSSGPHGPGSGPHGPASGPHGPNSGPYGPSVPPPPSSSPSPSPSPSGSPSPSPSPSPTPPLLTVTGLSVATGAPYQVIRGTDCCSNTLGPDWIDYPYVLQRNFGAGPSDPLYLIQTAIADTAAPDDPMITFSINRCARVDVIFGEKSLGVGCADPYPSWLQSGGWSCSVTGCGGTVETFYHETLGSADQVFGPSCSRNFPAGQVNLGPREPVATNADARMYTVFVQVPSGSCP